MNKRRSGEVLVGERERRECRPSYEFVVLVLQLLGCANGGSLGEASCTGTGALLPLQSWWAHPAQLLLMR